MLTNLPFDVLNLILEYDGRIKYSHKDKIYVNIISKNDYRYDIIKTFTNLKIYITTFLNIGSNSFKFYVGIYYKKCYFEDSHKLFFSKKIL